MIGDYKFVVLYFNLYKFVGCTLKFTFFIKASASSTLPSSPKISTSSKNFLMLSSMFTSWSDFSVEMGTKLEVSMSWASRSRPLRTLRSRSWIYNLHNVYLIIIIDNISFIKKFGKIQLYILLKNEFLSVAGLAKYLKYLAQ